MRLISAMVLMTLAVAPAEAQTIGVSVDPETLRLISEMELTRLVLAIVALLMTGALVIGWRALLVYRSTANAAAALRASESLRISAEDAAGHEERKQTLSLLWAMQQTVARSTETISAVNESVKAQTAQSAALTRSINDHTEGARRHREAMAAEVAEVKQAVETGYDKVGAMIQTGIADGMKAAAGVFADRLAAVMTPFSDQMALLNARFLIAAQDKIEAKVTEVRDEQARDDSAGAAGDTGGAAAGGVGAAGDGTAGDPGDEHTSGGAG